MRGWLRSAALSIAVAAAVIATPAVASATLVGLSGKASAPSRCFAPQQSAYASTSCQLFYGAQLELVALASRDDGSVLLEPQPFTFLALGPRGGSAPVTSFTLFDGNDADDTQRIVPGRSTDYQLRFNGNADIAAATSATMVVDVGARVTIPPRASSGRGSAVRIPATVVVPQRAIRGKLELRRCHRTKAQSARSCARARDYTVLARRTASQTRRVAFPVSLRPRSVGRFEIAFRPASRHFATTRQAFQVTRGYDGLISYRPVARRSPFGNR